MRGVQRNLLAPIGLGIQCGLHLSGAATGLSYGTRFGADARRGLPSSAEWCFLVPRGEDPWRQERSNGSRILSQQRLVDPIDVGRLLESITNRIAWGSI